MQIQFLEASVPLTKSYVRNADGSTTKTPYPFMWEFTSHAVTVTSLPQLEAALKKHAALNHCMLKGLTAKPLVLESRAGSTDPNGLTELLVLDIDGLPDLVTISETKEEVSTETKIKVTVDTLLNAMGLVDVSYVLQWSASYGIENTKLRCHIFMFLDRPAPAPLLKQWLIQLNHQTAILNASMALTKTGNTISWPLDISACQNDKLIYIAPPVLKGIKDPMNGKPRITLVQKKSSKVTLPSVINSSAKNKELTHKRLEALREISGLPKRKTTYKMHGSVEVMVKPDSCTVTGIKQERGYVYMNLNGGDSWAYFHHETNPDYIHNFKGEPAYLTKELLPEYWETLTSSGSKVNSNGIRYLAFCDRATGTYWRGSFDAAQDALDIYVAKNETQVRHFAKQHGLPLGDFIPEWDVVFDPHDAVRCDFTNRTVNMFSRTSYMMAVAKPVAQCPKTIYKVIHHALGSDTAITERFINWVAYILQQRDRAKTAWICHGVPGTGKGLMCNNILRPIFGKDQTAARRMEELDEPYNPWMKRTFLVFVDEVQTKALKNERGVMAKLKNFITEEFVPIREMYSTAIEARNRTSWLFLSNMSDPVLIEKDDRRFNVGKYQTTKLVISEKEVAQLERELQAFHDYLLFYKVDVNAATTVMHSEDRETMMQISQSSIDTVADQLLGGNFGFFMDQLPTNDAFMGNNVEIAKVADYENVLKELLNRTDRNTGACSIGREELRSLFNYVVGGMPSSPNKFTSLLKHHRIHIGAVWIAPKTVNGIKVTWKDLSSWTAHLTALAPPIKPAKSPKPKLAAVPATTKSS